MKTYKERTQSILQKAEVQRKKRKRIKLISILSGVAAFILAFNLVMFVPYTVGGTDITEYRSSEYYGVIKQLYGLTYSPRKTNNFKEMSRGLSNAVDRGLTIFAGMMGGAGASGSGVSNGNNYRETTLNQTDGVIEGDLFKRSDTHIFYLSYTCEHDSYDGWTGAKTHVEASYTLRVYPIAKEDSLPIVEYKISAEKGTTFDDNGSTVDDYGDDREMYLSEDLSTVTVITPCFDKSSHVVYTVVINIDVSDLSDIRETGRTYISGSYVSSRVVDSSMMLITNFEVRNNVDFGNIKLYVPHVGKKGKLKPLHMDDIVCPGNANEPHYTVICSIDKNLEVKDSVALLSYSDDVYVSQNNLFATREYRNTVKTENEYKLVYTHNMTEIRIVPYDNGAFGDTRSVTAVGSVPNRYCLDEYNNTLRAVTTVSFFGSTYDTTNGDPYAKEFKDRCMLYCYDLDTLEVKAKVADFAPAGESVKSARFYGDTAYVCTAEINYTINYITDPVFAFDLSDLNNITYKDTGTIPGYSLSLNKFAYDTLVGIGYGDDRRTLKIELYKQTENNVESVAKYEEYRVTFSTEIKAHLIDAENGIIGLAVLKSYPSSNRYMILRYDGETLTEIASAKTYSNVTDYTRATVIDGYVYIVESTRFDGSTLMRVVKIDED